MTTSFVPLSNYWRFTKDDNAQARLWAEKAIALDPNFPAAYTLAGWTYWNAVWNQWSENPQADLLRSSEMAHKAGALDDSNCDILTLLSALDWFQGRADQAVVDAKRAVAINPNYAAGYKALSDALFVVGFRPEEQLHAAEKAMRLDPARQDWYAYAVGAAYVQMGRYQDAITAFKRDLSVAPNDLLAHLFIAASYVELGREQEARAEAAEVIRISPQFFWRTGIMKNAALDERLHNDLRKAGLK